MENLLINESLPKEDINVANFPCCIFLALVAMIKHIVQHNTWAHALVI